MNPKISVTALSTLLLVGLALGSCQKYLDAKSDQRLVIPSTVGDLQALLDYYHWVNQFGPGSLETGTDDYFVSTTSYLSLQEWDRRQYTWEKDHLYPVLSNDWSEVYDNVYRANTVLHYWPAVRIEAGQQAAADDVKGQALFLRGHSFLKAVHIWAPAYEAATAATDLGIPLRLDPDFSTPSVRASVEETYRQILRDLKASVPLLPLRTPLPLRPARPAAYALVARTLLSMRRYAEAERYADSCLALQSELLDYNTVNTAAPFPFPRFNREVLYDSYQGSGSALYPTVARIDSALVAQYSPSDLRRAAFFKAAGDGYYAFKGSYSGFEPRFDGISLPEVYLTRAECRARAGKVSEAMEDLNTLLKHRYKAGAFTPLTAGSAAEALQQILTERRKELVMRALRWMDLKRLNREGAGITLRRVVNNQTFILPPNDPRYARAIPEGVIELSGMPQNPQ